MVSCHIKCVIFKTVKDIINLVYSPLWNIKGELSLCTIDLPKLTSEVEKCCLLYQKTKDVVVIKPSVIATTCDHTGWKTTGYQSRLLRRIAKQWASMSPGSPASSHTQKSSKFTNFRCLVFFTNSDVSMFQLPGFSCRNSSRSSSLPLQSTPRDSWDTVFWLKQIYSPNETYFSTFSLFF